MIIKYSMLKKMLVFGIIMLFFVPSISAINNKTKSINVIEKFENFNPDIVTFNPTDDTFINMRLTDKNYGSSEVLKVRNRYGHPMDPDYWKLDILIKFDISTIPSNAIINSASLYIYYFEWFDNNPAGRDLTLHMITGNWDEATVTWNNKPYIDPIVSSFAKVPNSPGIWMVWNVTSDVQKFVSGDKTNYGWQIMDEVYYGDFNIPYPKFYSKDYSGNGDEYIPYLEIDFTRSRNIDIANKLFLQIFERFPNAFPILRQLLGL